MNNQAVSDQIENDDYTIQPHALFKRLYEVNLNEEKLSHFFKSVQEIEAQRLDFVAFERYVVASVFEEYFGSEIKNEFKSIIRNRDYGGFITGTSITSYDNYIKLATAIAHLVGTPHYDAMVGKYYATFAVEYKDDSDSYLRDGSKRMHLHTDGAYEPEVIDWIMMMKLEERNTNGGDSRLLHIDDWKDLTKFHQNPISRQPVLRKPAKSKNMPNPTLRTTFSVDDSGGIGICFAEQNIQPETMEQALYFKEMLNSLESEEKVVEIPLSPGKLVMLNNKFWLHGRESFKMNKGLYRELLRIRGYFTKV